MHLRMQARGCNSSLHACSPPPRGSPEGFPQWPGPDIRGIRGAQVGGLRCSVTSKEASRVPPPPTLQPLFSSLLSSQSFSMHAWRRNLAGHFGEQLQDPRRRRWLKHWGVERKGFMLLFYRKKGFEGSLRPKRVPGSWGFPGDCLLVGGFCN